MFKNFEVNEGGPKPLTAILDSHKMLKGENNLIDSGDGNGNDTDHSNTDHGKKVEANQKSSNKDDSLIHNEAKPTSSESFSSLNPKSTPSESSQPASPQSINSQPTPAAENENTPITLAIGDHPAVKDITIATAENQMASATSSVEDNTLDSTSTSPSNPASDDTGSNSSSASTINTVPNQHTDPKSSSDTVVGLASVFSIIAVVLIGCLIYIKVYRSRRMVIIRNFVGFYMSCSIIMPFCFLTQIFTNSFYYISFFDLLKNK